VTDGLSDRHKCVVRTTAWGSWLGMENLINDIDQMNQINQINEINEMNQIPLAIWGILCKNKKSFHFFGWVRSGVAHWG